MNALSLNGLKQEYESKRESLRQAISELIDKGKLKDLMMIERVELATLEYNNAAKDYKEFIKQHFGRGKKTEENLVME